MPPQYMSNWYSFESIVGKLLSPPLGGKKIIKGANLAGHRVDYYFEEETTYGNTIRTAIEVKYSQHEISCEPVAEFGNVINFLREKDIVDQGIVVAYKGFTKSAIEEAKKWDIQLLTFAALEARAEKYGPIANFVALAKKEPPPELDKKLMFVLMPFSEELIDLYLYGIRGAAEKTGYTCFRADEIEHNSDILKEVLFYIEKAAILVAEVTEKNPNVFYEVGIAHGWNKEVILITKKGSDIPFDLREETYYL